MVDLSPHILVVTVDRCPDCPPGGLCADCTEHPELTYVVECPGVTDVCRTWWECMESHSEDDEERMENEEPVHGAEHQRVGGLGWCTPGSQCFLTISDSIPEEGEYATNGKPGRYPVGFDFGDPGEVFLHLIKTGEEAPA